MELLLIGLSRFARRRVLPAAAAMPEITAVDIASRHATVVDVAGTPKLRGLHADWRRALRARAPGLAYVSLVNSEHADAVEQALRLGWQVVVDKPALPDVPVAARMVELARRSSLVLAEAGCYAFHPMFAVVRELAAEATTAVAVFTPPVPADDFRHDRARGGGALRDTGPYLASLGRVLWGQRPEQVGVMVRDRTADGLDLSYSALARYPGGRTVVGHFGFTSAYQNTLQLAGGHAVVEVERPFSMPPDLATRVTVRDDGGQRVRSVPPADSMRLFLGRVLDAARTGSREFDAPLLGDARTLDRLVRAASGRDGVADAEPGRGPAETSEASLGRIH
ncbi:Gfo/Idh/MocA family protein [Streptacidiphilus sp. P02-A3a]|uniref:Gfo/Idh/MocA family protein n=1 Tax=Streptacidiphilus sp. P02-A3a TaxID=2704468 RepID=UPI0015FDD5F6|nr:Gfo/Idh/MocA family oxidoreductase [Streptacidiphilus sp. P02-A3a]QMU70549.1 Gfo/Idh/MocA family oxidoreductase [Streptacidiphilus sp. P02-A3a]